MSCQAVPMESHSCCTGYWVKMSVQASVPQVGCGFLDFKDFKKGANWHSLSRRCLQDQCWSTNSEFLAYTLIQDWSMSHCAKPFPVGWSVGGVLPALTLALTCGANWASWQVFINTGGCLLCTFGWGLCDSVCLVSSSRLQGQVGVFWGGSSLSLFITRTTRKAPLCGRIFFASLILPSIKFLVKIKIIYIGGWEGWVGWWSSVSRRSSVSSLVGFVSSVSSVSSVSRLSSLVGFVK
jgi:hypothetical protein